ncbi:MAG TPA: bacillithiol biosynthesis BshC, partial [Chitinophagaceae bacterium]|nr:bacillithiol biosynthesis BshC [Chitinophagaceae bacterium]
MLRTANTTGKKTTAEYISYQQTGLFSKLITDYLDGNATVHSFAQHPFTLEGIHNAIQQRQAYKQDRQLLVNELTKQYEKLAVAEAVSKNIQLLANENTFSVTTAHQPNILGGPLYFIYKILHAIQIANELNITFPQYHFVPVYYMGSEDADLEELNNITVGGYRYEWHTKQTGAVGRMKVDRAFETIIYNLHGQLGVLPYGE